MLSKMFFLIGTFIFLTGPYLIILGKALIITRPFLKSNSIGLRIFWGVIFMCVGLILVILSRP